MEDHIDIQVTEASDVQARIEATYTSARSADAVLGGTLSGPRREASRSLAATVKLHSVRRSGMPAVEAVLPDPCFWSPDLPFLYDLSLELRRGDELVDTADFSIALHPKRVVKQ